MAIFGVPPAYRDALVGLAALEDPQAAQLIDAVRAVPAFAPVSAILDAAGSVLDDSSSLSADLLIPPLLSLRGSMRHLPVGELASSLANSADLELDPAGRARLEARAEAIMGSEALGTTSIAIDLQTQHPRNFQSARIFTDIRPVFTDDLEDAPKGTVIVETLRIQTWDREGNTEPVSIAMDEADLRALQEVIGRALRKTATVKGMLEAQGLKYFQLDEEVD